VPVCSAKIATYSEDAKMMRHFLPVASPPEKVALIKNAAVCCIFVTLFY